MFKWALFLALVAYATAENKRLKEVFAWKAVDFAFEKESDRADAIKSGKYIPENNLPLGLDVWKDKLFVTVPRWKAGVASSLNYIDISDIDVTGGNVGDGDEEGDGPDVEEVDDVDEDVQEPDDPRLEEEAGFGIAEGGAIEELVPEDELEIEEVEEGGNIVGDDDDNDDEQDNDVEEIDVVEVVVDPLEDGDDAIIDIDGVGDALPDVGATLAGVGDALPDVGETLNGVTDALPDVGATLGGVTDALPDVGETLGGVTDALPDVGETLNGVTGALPDVGETLGGVTDALPDVGETLNGVTGALPDVGETLGGVTDALPDVGETLNGVTGALPDVGETLGGVTDALPDVGETLNGVTGALPDVGETLGGVTDALPDVGETLGGVTGALPDVGATLGGVGDALPDVGGTLGGVTGALPNVGGVLGGLGGALPGGRADAAADDDDDDYDDDDEYDDDYEENYDDPVYLTDEEVLEEERRHIDAMRRFLTTGDFHLIAKRSAEADMQDIVENPLKRRLNMPSRAKQAIFPSKKFSKKKKVREENETLLSPEPEIAKKNKRKYNGSGGKAKTEVLQVVAKKPELSASRKNATDGKRAANKSQTKKRGDGSKIKSSKGSKNSLEGAPTDSCRDASGNPCGRPESAPIYAQVNIKEPKGNADPDQKKKKKKNAKKAKKCQKKKCKEGKKKTCVKPNKVATPTSPALIPYPSWEANQPSKDPKDAKITSVFRVRVDACDRLWVMDTGVEDILGKYTVYTPPQIIIYNLNNDKIVKTYQFKPEDSQENSFYANIVVDVTKDTCGNAFAYIPDLGSYAIVVYDLKNDKAHRIKHNYFHFNPLEGNYNVGGVNFQWTDGVFGVALTRHHPDGSRTAYFHALSSYSQFKTNTFVLQNEEEGKASNYTAYALVGDKGPKSQTSASFIHEPTGVMFYTQVNKDAIYCWNSDKHFYDENLVEIASDPKTMIFPNDLKVDYNNNLWVLTDKLPIFVKQGLDSSEVHYRIFVAPVAEAIKDTNCAP